MLKSLEGQVVFPMVLTVHILVLLELHLLQAIQISMGLLDELALIFIEQQVLDELVELPQDEHFIMLPIIQYKLSVH